MIPTLTLNLGVRWDTESFYGLDPITGPFKAFSLTNQWSPRVGVVWDFVGDGTSKLYASAGRFYYSMPTDLNVRVYTANSVVVTYNYDSASITQDDAAPRHQLFQGGSAAGEPIDEGTKASYQDELTIGVEKAIDPTLSVGLKGTYRALGRTIEDRCDLNSNIGPDCPDCAPPPAPSSTRAGPGPRRPDSIRPATARTIPTTRVRAPARREPGTGVAIGPSRRIFRGIELTARKQFSNQLWAQLSFLYSSLRGNYSGAISEATGQTDPGINADFDYYQFSFNAYGNLELDRPVQARLDAVYNAPFGLSAGLQFYVRSGLPISRLGWFNDGYGAVLYLDTRGSDGANADRLRDERLGRLQPECRAGDDHADALPLQRSQPADGHARGSVVQPEWQLRDRSVEPVLRSGRGRARHPELSRNARRRPAPTTRTTSRRFRRGERGRGCCGPR